MFICEAALVHVYKVYTSEYMECAKPGYESTKGFAREFSRDEKTVVMPNGVKEPGMNSPLIRLHV